MYIHGLIITLNSISIIISSQKLNSMKKFTFPALLLFLLVLITHNSNAQSPKYCLIEEFTQASCPPCAAQNPGFEANILEPNPGTVRQISYHTSWPGVDPMYNYNEAS